MNPSLLLSFESLEVQRIKILELISTLSDDQLNAHSEGKWSIAQILSHIIASEQLSVNYINKKILGIKESSDTGLFEELKMIALILSQRLPFLKFKAPNTVVEKTISYDTTNTLHEAWQKTRNELKKVLVLFDEDQLNRKVYRHPIAGIINIKQAMRFFSEHILHHSPQIKKLV